MQTFPKVPKNSSGIWSNFFFNSSCGSGRPQKRIRKPKRPHISYFFRTRSETLCGQSNAQVTCPGVWLCPNGRIRLVLSMLNQEVETRRHPPVFPMLIHEQFSFHKVGPFYFLLMEVMVMAQKNLLHDKTRFYLWNFEMSKKNVFSQMSVCLSMCLSVCLPPVCLRLPPRLFMVHDGCHQC